MEKGPKRKAKLEPIVEEDTEEREEREEKEEKVEEKRVKKIEEGKAVDRSYPILEHNSTTIYLTPYEGYADNARFLERNNIRFIVNVTKLGEKGRPNYFENRFLQRTVTGFDLKNKKKSGYIQYIPEYYRLSMQDAGEDAPKLYRGLPSVAAWIEEKSLMWKDVQMRLDYLITDKYGILIHCNAGQCRSVSVLVGFLMTHGFFRLRSALQFAEAAVPGASIRTEFMDKLKIYEMDIHGQLSVPNTKEATEIKNDWRDVRDEARYRFSHSSPVFLNWMKKRIARARGETRAQGRTKRPRVRGKILGDHTGDLEIGEDAYSSEEDEDEEEEEDFDFLF
jgi:hypothetical protein